ncbi:MAG: glutathione S-transferase N-terminal domain-containing protein, partial [Cyanobacteria bacterium J06623_7]
MKLKIGRLCLAMAISVVGLVSLPKISTAQEATPENLETSDAPSSLILYGSTRSRSQVVAWYLAELGIDYQAEAIDLGAGENEQPEYLAINPMGKLPALVDGDFSIWESGAILWYLAYKYDDMPSELTEQAQIVQWILFANSTLGNGLF